MSLRQQIKQAWNALAYADACELLPFEEKCRLLGVEPPPDQPRYPPSRARAKVAVNLGTGCNPALIRHAVGMASQLGAELVLLTHADGPTLESLNESLACLRDSGLGYRVETLRGPWADAMANYLCRHGEVSFLLITPQDLNYPQDKRQPNPVRRRPFPVPLVLVEDGA